jgi:hypothetical protein
VADNSVQSGADTIRDKDRTGVKTQIVGLDLGIGTGTESLMAGSMPVTGTGTAGTPATGVQTVQGIASGTPVPVSLATNTPDVIDRAARLLGVLSAGTNQIGTVGELRAATAMGTITGAAAAITTLTLTAPGAGLFHYITALTIDLYSTAARTGVATPIVVTSTNLTGSTAWTFSTAGAIGAVDRYTVPMATPLRSATANTATTIVGPAVTGGLWRINVAYFTAA